jgi:hypothetical protein
VKVWGIGSATAWKLIDEYRLLSLDALRKASNRDPSLLNHNQKLGLQYYDDINTRIPRSEVTAIGAEVITAMNKVSSAAVRLDPPPEHNHPPRRSFSRLSLEQDVPN